MYGGRYGGRGGAYNRHESRARPREDFMSSYESYMRGSDRYGNYNSTSSYYGRGSGSLEMSGVDLYIQYNTRAHHTNEFDITDGTVYDSREVLVVRRGQPFYMKIMLNQPYTPAKDNLRLVFLFGKNPNPARGTQVELFLSTDSGHNAGGWGINIEASDGASVSLSVSAPPTCLVGKWYLKVDLLKEGGNTRHNMKRYDHKDPIYILFNPWCKYDQVFMSNDELLGEYVMNETGKIYNGSSQNISFMPWNFGQFSGKVLDCVMYLLDELSNLPEHQRGDAVKVSRMISSLVNSSDNNGVVVGNWSGRYQGGASPMSWTGSVDILEQYYKTKRPVKYGQCFIFAAVVATVCRALGIPVRCVTNYNSAHDTDASVTIDKYFNRNFEEIEELNKDSIWNFHVWNDVWMTRPDLPAGYNGWQAIDATPQEKSKGIYCMGPASLTAVKNGHIRLPHDAPFVFAEVNADRIMWMGVSPHNRRMIKKETNLVGQFMSTKKPLSLTETTDWRLVSNRLYYFDDRFLQLNSSTFNLFLKQDDVAFELKADNNTFIGQPLNAVLIIKNLSKMTRTVGGHVSIKSVYYTGATYREVVKGDLPKTSLRMDEDKRFQMEVPVRYYLEKLTDHCFLKITFSCMVEETGQAFAEVAEVRLRKPHITIKAPNTGYIGQTFKVEASFMNPLPTPLTNSILRVEGPGFQKPVTYRIQDVDVGKGMNVTLEFTPVKVGEKEIIMNFCSDELANVNAAQPVYIHR
ncbi:protein-glutamine gamma-glutamyltransferase K-like [Ruditapes philippinarum]|uniref:protein-glutamine gamma-glutamyltransferase K-like n=1 Tax=Ruditapes philippinarum TaxID=129788 RepID=UPI00295B9A77|nr:protein-glutamine gamma-glutamyltransferase K-like [Ruditapes philippinarum]